MRARSRGGGGIAARGRDTRDTYLNSNHGTPLGFAEGGVFGAPRPLCEEACGEKDLWHHPSYTQMRIVSARVVTRVRGRMVEKYVADRSGNSTSNACVACTINFRNAAVSSKNGSSVRRTSARRTRFPQITIPG